MQFNKIAIILILSTAASLFLPTLYSVTVESQTNETGSKKSRQPRISKTKNFPNGTQIEYVEDELLVKFRENKVPLDDKSVFDQAQVSWFELRNDVEGIEELHDQNIMVVKIEDGKDPFDKLKEFKNNNLVEEVSVNFKYQPSSISTNDVHKAELWGLDNTGQTVNGTEGSNDADIDWPEAVAYHEGSSEVIVAIIDTGVSYDHPDLDGVMWDGSSCVDHNNNPLGDCIHGYDYEEDDKDPRPYDWYAGPHGSHIAGTIAAERNNGTGIIGISSNVKIMALKSALYTSEIIQAISFAENNGAKVINASYSLTGSACADVYSFSEHAAIAGFDGLFIAAAGNDTEHTGVDSMQTPSGYTADTACWTGLDNVISVASTNSNDELSWFSNYSDTYVDLGAPGSDIISTVPESEVLLELLYDADDPDVEIPGLPTGWTESGGDSNIWLTTEIDGAEYISSNDTPYGADIDESVTSNTFDLTSKGNITFNINASCDTEFSDPDSGGDYVELLFSSDGSSFTSFDRINEYSLEDGGGFSYDGIYYEDWLTFDLPSEYSNTANFKFRLRFVTDSSDNSYNGCDFDYIGLSSYGGEAYEFYNGTSMATPHVVGAAAYLWSARPSASYLSIADALINYGDSISSLDGNTVSGKRLNLYNSIYHVVNSKATLSEITPVSTPTSDTTPQYTFTSDQAGDITYGGSCTSATTTAIAGTNAIAFSALGDGTYSDCTITVTNELTNDSDALSVSTFVIDTDKPTVVITSSDGSDGETINTSPMDIIFTFSEPVSGFTLGDISATNASLSNFSAPSSTVYSVDATPTGQATVQISVNGSAVIDTAGNSNDASSTFELTYDSVGPTLAEVTPISDPVSDSTPDYTFSSNEVGSITYGGSCSSVTTSATTGNNTITLDALSDGTYSDCTVTVTDGAGNSSTPLTITSFRVDALNPTLVISSSSIDSGDLTNISPIPLTFTFSEDILDFVSGDIDTTNGTIGDFTQVSNSNYTANITPTGQGMVSLEVTDTKYIDSSGNPNLETSSFNYTYDSSAPIIAEVTPVSDPTTDNTPDYTFSSDEAGDITYGGSCDSSTSSASSGNNTITLNDLSDGDYDDCTITVTDAAGNESITLDITDFTVDTSIPTMVITSTTVDDDGITNVSPASLTFTFSEDVANFVLGDIDLTNGSISSVSQYSSTVFTGNLTPTGQGLVSIEVDAGKYNDLNGNANIEASNFSYSYDSIAPVLAEVTPISNSTTDTTPEYTFSSDEAGDITYGGDCSSITASAVSGNNTITLNELSDATYSNCTILVTDSASNESNTITITEFTVDSSYPSLTITSGDVSNGGYINSTPVDLVLTFSEDVQGFTVDDYTLVNNSISGFSSTTDQLYSSISTPTAEGLVSITVAAGSFSDLNSNACLVDASFSYVYDSTAPVIAQVTPVSTPTTDTTPNYVFSSTEAGSITYVGDCSSSTTSASLGNNTITFSALSKGVHSNCKIKVTDNALNYSNLLSVSSFEVTSEVVVSNEEVVEEEEVVMEIDEDIQIDIPEPLKSDLNIKFGSKIELSLDDDAINHYEYKWNDDDDWKRYNDGFTVLPGKNELHVRAIGHTGQELTSRTESIKAQKKNPVYDLRVGELDENGRDIKIKWNSRSDDISKFSIYRYTVENNEKVNKELVAINDKDDHTYTDEDIDLDVRKIAYKVQAYDEDEVDDEEVIEVKLPWYEEKTEVETYAYSGINTASSSGSRSSSGIEKAISSGADYWGIAVTNDYDNDVEYYGIVPISSNSKTKVLGRKDDVFGFGRYPDNKIDKLIFDHDGIIQIKVASVDDTPKDETILGQVVELVPREQANASVDETQNIKIKQKRVIAYMMAFTVVMVYITLLYVQAVKLDISLYKYRKK